MAGATLLARPRGVAQGADLRREMSQAEVEAGVPGGAIVSAGHDMELVREAQALYSALKVAIRPRK